MNKRETKTLRGPVPRHKEDDQVVYIDENSAPRILFSGTDLLFEDLPIGTRVIYAKPPIEGLANPGAAIRYALNHPLECKPLYAQLLAEESRHADARAGMAGLAGMLRHQADPLGADQHLHRRPLRQAGRAACSGRRPARADTPAWRWATVRAFAPPPGCHRPAER